MELDGINQALHEYLHLYIVMNVCIQATAIITYSLFIVPNVSIMQSRKSKNISDLSYTHKQGIVISQNAEPDKSAWILFMSAICQSFLQHLGIHSPFSNDSLTDKISVAA